MLILYLIRSTWSSLAVNQRVFDLQIVKHTSISSSWVLTLMGRSQRNHPELDLSDYTLNVNFWHPNLSKRRALQSVLGIHLLLNPLHLTEVCAEDLPHVSSCMQLHPEGLTWLGSLKFSTKFGIYSAAVCDGFIFNGASARAL